uniref:Uncharacterized protein n=1 Tax=Oryza sativa subsp. japonica TaxID=39947 RepID=Q2QQJ0_ORYSJ|nr:hypothetical protein LOC_Os12g30870 [Oryza sativa Japonica Group]
MARLERLEVEDGPDRKI